MPATLCLHCLGREPCYTCRTDAHVIEHMGTTVRPTQATACLSDSPFGFFRKGNGSTLAARSRVVSMRLAHIIAPPWGSARLVSSGLALSSLSLRCQRGPVPLRLALSGLACVVVPLLACPLLAVPATPGADLPVDAPSCDACGASPVLVQPCAVSRRLRSPALPSLVWSGRACGVLRLLAVPCHPCDARYGRRRSSINAAIVVSLW
jgi:hypothetical protein